MGRCIRSFALVVLTATAAGCGTQTNFNRIWGGEDDAGDSRLFEAQAAYDSGRFDEASTRASELVIRNPDNEEASILLGYIHLSQGGIDPFILANELIKLSPSSTTSSGTGSSVAGQELYDAMAPFLPRPTAVSRAYLAKEGISTFGATGATGSGGTATTTPTTASTTSLTTTLQQLSDLIANVSDSDRTTLLGHAFAAADNNNVAPTLFVGDNAIVVPGDIDTTVEPTVGTLQHMTDSIRAVCRFVDDVAKPSTITDARNCATTTLPRASAAKANFLWAFSHLTEALVYESVLLYVVPANTAAVPSITAVGTQLSQTQTTSITTAAQLTSFVADVAEVTAGVTEVFNATDAKSMLTATINSLDMVTAAFGVLSGLPTSVTSQITSSISSLNSLAGSNSDLSARSKALTAQMTSSLTKSLGSSIDTAANTAATKYGASSYADLKTKAAADPTIANNADYKNYTSQITSMCSSYTTLSKSASGTTAPAVCSN